MKPINDAMATKDSADANKLLGVSNLTELSNIANDNLPDAKSIADAASTEALNSDDKNQEEIVKINKTNDLIEKTKIDEITNIPEDNEESKKTNFFPEKIKSTINENICESKVNETDIDEENVSKCVNIELQTDNDGSIENSENKTNSCELEINKQEKNEESITHQDNDKKIDSTSIENSCKHKVNEEGIAEKNISILKSPQLQIDNETVTNQDDHNKINVPFKEKELKLNEEIIDVESKNKLKTDSESITNPGDKNVKATFNENTCESKSNVEDKYPEPQKNDSCNNNKDKIKVDEKDVDTSREDTEQQSDSTTNEEDCTAPEDKRTKETDFASEEDSDAFEDVEDLEIPGEGEVDEIIVPDEAEAEDLTDGRDKEDEIDKSINEDDVDDEEEDAVILKDSENEENEIEASLNEEETTKSSDVDERDDDSDKKSLNNDAQENTSAKHSDEEDIVDLESEIIALDDDMNDEDSSLDEPKSSEPHVDEDTSSHPTSYDPLNCAENSKTQNDENAVDGEESAKIVENENSSESQLSVSHKNEATNDEVEEEEDDEVQFVETRNSPICIESDDDDGNSKDTTKNLNSCTDTKKIGEDRIVIATATTTVIVPKNITVKRTSARKSTAKPQRNEVKGSPVTMPRTQNKTKIFNNLQKATNSNKRSFTSTSAQRIVDCIELLDSSDEETSSSRRNKAATQQQQKTPQKRTLLAAKGNYYKNKSNKTPNTIKNTLPTNFPTHIRQQAKKPAPPILPPPTPQSNFLNAVQLQPTAVSGQNPPAFSALLSNKNVIIPNAFYGNPPSVRGITPEMEQERRHARWLENFVNQFGKPQFVPTHSCLVFLQKALKYKDFVRIKSLRANMNNYAQNTNMQANTHLMFDLKTILFKNTRRLTDYGRRFCELTCSATPGKDVTLMAHGITGKSTLKTCSMDLPKSTNTAATSSIYSSTNTALTRKRQLDEDEDDEYTPDKFKNKTKTKPPSENGDEDSSEIGDDRKRSLRTKRTKRLDNSFSYNEDDLLAEYEIDDEEDEKLVQVEIQRKIEQKRLEAQQQRQQQAKSFESAFIQAFARTADVPTTSSSTKTTKNATTMQLIRLNKTTTETVTNIRQYTANNDAEDLLQATWIENVENDDAQVISDDDEPKEHRIYKKQQQHKQYQLLQQQQEQQEQQQQQENQRYSQPKKLPTTTTRYNSNPAPKVSRKSQPELIIGDTDYNERYYNNAPQNVDPMYWPKNVDVQMYVNGKHKDRCVICSLTCQRLVHHYVNEHRGSEVYNSRLSPSQIKLLKQGRRTQSTVSLYKNGQYQYEAYCIFCEKNSRFMLPYWHQHFTMHTGEYAYRCTGCGLRKPTRSLLTQHQVQGCSLEHDIVQDYAYDPKSTQIEAKICVICNYVQLHRSNIVKHLHKQHNIKQILPKHIQTLVLMKTQTVLTTPPTPTPSTSTSVSPPPYAFETGPHNSRRSSSRISSMRASSAFVIDDDDVSVAYEEILPEDTQQPETNAEINYYNYIPPYMQEAVNSGNFSFEDAAAGDDLSYMICGMLDVQMNSDAN